MRREFLLVVFGGNPFGTGELSRIRHLGLSESNVKHISGSNKVLASLYKRASAFVYPSFYEGFGIPPLEAMSFDCPVACSNTSSLPEVVGDAALLFDPEDTDAIRTSIENVLTSPEIRATLISRGRERIKRFSWDRCASETVKIYRELVA
jgi:glycosyltransferase involved in cell wall biosynthesis